MYARDRCHLQHVVLKRNFVHISGVSGYWSPSECHWSTGSDIKLTNKVFLKSSLNGKVSVHVPAGMPAAGERTPEECATAERVKAPVAGMAPQKPPATLHSPSATISCVASTRAPEPAVPPPSQSPHAATHTPSADREVYPPHPPHYQP